MAASAALTSCGEWYRSKVKVVCCCARATGPPAHTTDPAVSASVSSRRHDRGMNPSRCGRPVACGLWPMAWLGACPCPLQVLAACHLHPDRLAGRDEGRHHDLHAVLEARFLPDVVVALRVHGRRGVGDLDLDDVGEGNAHGLAVEELHREDHPFLQVAHRAPEAVVPDRHLLVGLGVHEVAGVVVAVQELHVLALGLDRLDQLVGAKPTFPHRAGVEVQELGVRHAAHLALAAVILGTDDPVEHALHPHGHPRTQFRTWQHGISSWLASSWLASESERFYATFKLPGVSPRTQSRSTGSEMVGEPEDDVVGHERCPDVSLVDADRLPRIGELVLAKTVESPPDPHLETSRR